MGIHNNALIGASSQGYQISRSVRLRRSASAYMNRTFGTPTSNIKWTWSCWFKRGQLGVSQRFFGRGSDASGINQTALTINSDNTINFFVGDGAGGLLAYLATTQVFRDPSAWYNIHFIYDSANATANDRMRMFVNGAEITTFSSRTNPSSSMGTQWNVASVQHNIGVLPTSPSNYFDGYLTEINFIDGQALTPSSFGETNAVTGVWQPKAYSGTYGTNGFYLNFSDNSAVTTSSNVGIGKDFSGNGNYWTSNSISVTAGVTYDSMLDVPTPYADGGNGRGNYAVLNVLSQHASNVTTLSGGNLNVSGNGCLATISMPSGKWYWEATCTSADADQAVGILDIVESNTGAVSGTINPNRGVIYQANTNVRKNGTIVANYATFTNGDVLGLTFDASNNQIAFYKNNTLQGTITADAPIVSYVPHAQTLGGAFSYNFGQRPFSYTPPTGFVALNTQNLPTPTISNGANYMAATLYSGNSGTQSITNTVNGVSFQPDFVWGKSRNIAENHALFDIVRGVNKTLYANLTNAEATDPGVSAFNSNGFTLNGATINNTGYTYVAWQWNAGGSTVTNTSGTISAQVRANPTAGFSVVTYTGTGANATVGHGLNATPAMIMVKNRDSGAIGGAVYHTSLGATKYLKLFQTTTGTDGQATDNTAWNGGSPTFNSSVFSVGSLNRTNSSQQMVAYCFAAVAGYSAFGSYTGNNSTDGPFVYLGFRPRWVMVKRSDAAGENWIIQDTSRSAYNVPNEYLIANSSAIEAVGTPLFDINSNGFKVRSAGTGMNGNLATYIYMAFAENPFKLSLAR